MTNIKRLTGVLISTLIISAAAQSAFAGSTLDSFKSILSYNDQKVSLKLDGKNISFPDVQPYVNEDNRTMVPVRFVSEALGCEVRWDEDNQLVIITKGNKRIVLKINQNWAIVNDTKSDVRKEFDTKAVLKNDRTMVPLRFVSETLGAGVAWDEVNNVVILRSDGVIEQVVTATTTPTPTPTPKYTPIIIDYQATHPTPTPTPPPVNQWKNKEVPMTLIEDESDLMPEGFIKPQLVVKHLPDGLGSSYFTINIKNILDYKNTAIAYAYKVTCLNYDLVNTHSGMQGIDRLDTLNNLSRKFASYGTVNPVTWLAPSVDVKYVDYPELGSVAIHAGITLNMQFEFYYAGLKHIYRDNVELKQR